MGFSVSEFYRTAQQAYCPIVKWAPDLAGQEAG